MDTTKKCNWRRITLCKL